MTIRATTPEAKRAIIGRLLRSWLAAPDLRLGQLLIAACEHRVRSVDPFHVEDEPLATFAEEMAKPAPHDLTPSQIALAKMLDAWEKWPGEDRDKASEILCLLCGVLTDEGLWVGGGPSAAGRELLDRARKAGVL